MTLVVRDEPTTSVALTDEHYLSRLPALAEQIAASSMCPEQFRGKPADVAVVGLSLADNGLRLSLSTLGQCYVIGGKCAYMAQIQAAMCALHGIDLHPIDELCDDKSATVEMTLPNGRTYRVSFTMGEAEKAGLAGKDMYKKWGPSMLVARAMTRAIDRHAPAVKLGLGNSINMAELGVIDATSRPSVAAGSTTYSPGAAKKKLIDAYEGRGYGHDQAIDLAKIHWKTSGHDGNLTQQQLDDLLAVFNDEDSDSGAQPASNPGPASTGPDAATEPIAEAAPATTPPKGRRQKTAGQQLVADLASRGVASPENQHEIIFCASKGRTVDPEVLTDKEIHSCLDIAEWIRDGKKTWDDIHTVNQMERARQDATPAEVVDRVPDDVIDAAGEQQSISYGQDEEPF